MNFLPIASRELRVAARKRSTFWLRDAAALAVLVIAGAALLMAHVSWAGTSQVGRLLFYVLTWLCLVAGLASGLFFTSDCLSEEKREGTLGLLFLTDLRGYDVALGKLLAGSLRSFYSLLAVFPILAITLLLGGVSAGQYWKSALALVNALFFSLTTGMAVSAVSRDSQRAMAATLFVVLLLSAGGPGADGVMAGLHGRSFSPFWSLASPAWVLMAAGGLVGTSYWKGLLATQLIGWSMLALSSALVPHAWQDPRRNRYTLNAGFSYAWRYGGAARRARVRRRLVEQQPVAWLICRERWQALGLWALAFLLVTGFCWAGIKHQDALMLWSMLGALLAMVLYLWAASQSCRFFVEARRSGLLELLLATPLKERHIIDGQWAGLRHMFGLPLLLLLGCFTVGTVLSQQRMHRSLQQASSTASTVITHRNGSVTSSTIVSGTAAAQSSNSRLGNPSMASSGSSDSLWSWGISAATALAEVGTVGMNLLALCWFGMWMGLTSRTANLAALKTLMFVQVIPLFVIFFSTNMLIGVVMSALVLRNGPAQSNSWFLYYQLINILIAAGLAITKDVVFIVWSRSRLYRSLRVQAALGLGKRINSTRPAPAVAAPPVIPPGQ